jgi:hypothetical protein
MAVAWLTGARAHLQLGLHLRFPSLSGHGHLAVAPLSQAVLAPDLPQLCSPAGERRLGVLACSTAAKVWSWLPGSCHGALCCQFAVSTLRPHSSRRPWSSPLLPPAPSPSPARALRSLVASHHAGQAAAPWPLLRARRERAGHAPRRLRATRWPRRSRTTRAAHCAGPLGRTAGGAELAAPGRRAGAMPKPRPRRGRALAPKPRPRRGRAPAPEPRPGHPRRAAGAAVSGRAEGRGGEREGEGERRRGRERGMCAGSGRERRR